MQDKLHTASLSLIFLFIWAIVTSGGNITPLGMKTPKLTVIKVIGMGNKIWGVVIN